MKKFYLFLNWHHSSWRTEWEDADFYKIEKKEDWEYIRWEYCTWEDIEYLDNFIILDELPEEKITLDTLRELSSVIYSEWINKITDIEKFDKEKKYTSLKEVWENWELYLFIK